MALSREEVLKIAKLAHIEVTESELAAFQDKISSVLEYVGQLQELDLKGVEPTAHVSGVTNVLRTDEVKSCDPETRERLLNAMPAREGDYLKVKAIFG
jgi:aspartyl-tRNA(Asn)/glutamyl-tRNA(Gln) amidotransferase subunit C